MRTMWFLRGLVLALVLASCVPLGADTVADSADKSATATPQPTNTRLPASTKSATNTPLLTQTDIQPTAPPTDTPTAPPKAIVCDPGPAANCKGANLGGARLRNADLTGADLSGANLEGAVLRRADLRGAILFEADLRGADLGGADLTDANLSRADLSYADLRDADLTYTNLEGADLRYAELRGATVLGANLRMADLSLTNLHLVDLYGANYNADTKWPAGFDPVGAGAALGTRLGWPINEHDYEEGATLSAAGLTAVQSFRADPEISGYDPDADPFVVPTVRIWYSGQGEISIATEEPVLEYEGLAGPISYYSALIQIVEMDGGNDTGEVLYSESSGGNHCCTSVIVFGQDTDGIWKTIDVGTFYTAAPFGAVALQGSDGYVMHTLDRRFHRFGRCEACWRAPRMIFAIESGQVVDVSDRPAFVPLFREDARRMKEQMSDSESGTTGFWAGYVATKARAGEFDEAWEMMLASTDPIGAPRPGLEAFLKEAGYISSDKVVD